MAILGLDAGLVAPAWDPARFDPAMERLGEAGVRLLEVALARPQLFDGARARAFAQRWNVSLFLRLSPPPEIDPLERLQEGLDYLEPMLRAAADAGAVGVSGLLPSPTASGVLPRAASPDAIDALSRFLERAARLARAHDLRLALQPVGRAGGTLVNTAGQAVWLVERVGSESLGVALDTGVMAGEEEGFAAAFGVAEPFLAYVRAAESNRGLLGRGVLDWPAVLAALKETGYAGPVTASARAGAPERGLPGPWARGRGVRLDEMIEEGLPVLRAAAAQAGMALG